MNWNQIDDYEWSIVYQGTTYYIQWDDYPESSAFLWEFNASFDLRAYSGSKNACLAQIKHWQETLPEILMEEAL